MAHLPLLFQALAVPLLRWPLNNGGVQSDATPPEKVNQSPQGRRKNEEDPLSAWDYRGDNGAGTGLHDSGPGRRNLQARFVAGDHRPDFGCRQPLFQGRGRLHAPGQRHQDSRRCQGRDIDPRRHVRDGRDQTQLRGLSRSGNCAVPQLCHRCQPGPGPGFQRGPDSGDPGFHGRVTHGFVQFHFPAHRLVFPPVCRCSRVRGQEPQGRRGTQGGRFYPPVGFRTRAVGWF